MTIQPLFGHSLLSQRLANPPARPESSPIPAFPGAEGAGAFTKGGRGGRILGVTTLADYLPGRDAVIPGSLRSAIEAKGPRIVVFRVSGNIDLKDEIVVREPFLPWPAKPRPERESVSRDLRS